MAIDGNAAVLASLLRGGRGGASGSYLARNPQFQAGQNLAQFGSDTGPTNIAGGLARLLAGGLGGVLASRASDQDRAQRAEANRYLSALLRGEKPDLAATGESDNPYLSDLGQNYLQSSLTQQAEQARFEREAGLRQGERADELAFRREQAAREDAYRRSQLGLQERELAIRAATSGQPRTQTELQQRDQLARAAGLEPGSPEYRDYVLYQKRAGEDKPSLGNSQLANALAILNDPNARTDSPDYQAAYQIALAEKRYSTLPNGEIVETATFNPRSFRPPTGQFGFLAADSVRAQAPAPSAGAPAQAPQEPVATPGGAAPSAQSPAVTPAAAPAAPAGPGSRSVVGSSVSQSQLQKASDIVAEAQSTLDSLGAVRSALGAASFLDRASAVAGVPTERGASLQAAGNIAALLAKGDSLFRLGVLSGPDLQILRDTLGDLSSARGLAQSGDAINARIDQVENLIRGKVNNYLNSQRDAGLALPPALGLKEQPAPAPAPAASAPAPTAAAPAGAPGSRVIVYRRGS